jgi:hypothetical protein
MQIIGILVGIIGGVVWEMLSTSPFKNFPTLFPSLLVNNSSKILHIHHWIFYLTVLLVTLGWSLKNQKLLHPAVLMIVAFLSSAILYNFYKFGDWYKFIK